MKRFFLLLALVSFVCSCSDFLERPMANPGAPQKVSIGALVQLDGSNSADPRNLPLTFLWRMSEVPAQSTATLLAPTTSKPSFRADRSGTFRAALIVSNGTGASDTAFALVEVDNCGGNTPVIDAITAAPTMPSVGAIMSLGAKVTHGDEQAPCTLKRELHYAWTVSKRPAGSASQLLQADTATPAMSLDVAGDYELTLVVTDDQGHKSAPKALAVKVGNCGSQAPSKVDITASSDAPAIGQTVQFDAAVTDPDTDASCGKTESFSYAWSLVALPQGSLATLTLPEAKNPSIEIDKEGTYTVLLVASDAAGHTSPIATKTIKASSCGGNAPVVGTILASTASIGKPVILDATITDADNDAPCTNANKTITYQWKLVAQPAGSKSALNVATVEKPSFTPDVAGDYVVSLVATDAEGHASAAKTLTVTVATCGGNVPVIGAVTANPASFAANQNVALSAVVTDGDQQAPCNIAETFSYDWSIAAAPKGSFATLAQAKAAQPTFVADVPGSYTFALTVTDAQNHTSATKYQTFTSTSCGSTPPTARIGQLLPSTTPGGAAVVAPMIAIGNTVQVTAARDGSASFDPDNVAPCNSGQTLTFEWKFLELPLGSNATLNSSTIVNPSFTADVCGNYVLGLVATDSTNKKSTMATFTISAAVALTLPPNFTATVLACAGQGLNTPCGVTSKPSTGEIFIANVVPRSILKMTPGTGQVTTLATNLFGQNDEPRKVVYSATTDNLFFTVLGGGSVNIRRLSLAGVQSDCPAVAGTHYHGMAVHTTASGTLRLLAATGNAARRVDFLNPTNCALDKSNNFGPVAVPGSLFTLNVGGIVRNDAVLGQVDDIFINTDNSGSDNDLLRNETPASGLTPQGVLTANNTGVTDVVANNRLPNLVHINCEGEIAIPPCPTKKILVANGSTLRLFTNGVSPAIDPNTNGTDVVTGFVGCDANGLSFEDANNLLVTSTSSNGLLRITGDFCSL
jgi:PKD repeat protein